MSYRAIVVPFTAAESNTASAVPIYGLLCVAVSCAMMELCSGSQENALSHVHTAYETHVVRHDCMQGFYDWESRTRMYCCCCWNSYKRDMTSYKGKAKALRFRWEQELYPRLKRQCHANPNPS